MAFNIHHRHLLSLMHHSERELRYLLTDSGATALLVLDDLYAAVAREVLEDPARAPPDNPCRWP